jgi:hypothetical protein
MEDLRVGESLVPRLLQPLFQIPPWLLGQMLHTQSKTARSFVGSGYWGEAGGKEGQPANSPNTVTTSPLFPFHNS